MLTHGNPRSALTAGHSTKNLVKLVNAYALQVADAIEGGSKSVSLTELSGGARIARVFSELFPFEVAKIELDEADLRSRIAYVYTLRLATCFSSPSASSSSGSTLVRCCLLLEWHAERGRMNC
jgi:hypothetical protein